MIAALLVASALLQAGAPVVSTRPLSAEVDVLEVRTLELTRWTVTGSLTLLPGEEGPSFRARAVVEAPDAAPRALLAEVRDGVYTAVDEEAGTYVRGPVPLPGDLGAGNDAWLAPLLLARPWLEPPRAEDLERGRPQSFDGETCEVFESEARTWLVSRATGLPRLATRRAPLPLGESLSSRTRWTYGEPPVALEPLAVPESSTRVELPRTVEAGAGAGVPVTQLEGTLEPLREAFDAARGRPRIVAIFAPS